MSEKCHVCEREKGKMPLCGRGLPGATFADLADCYQVAYGLARRDVAAAEERGRRAGDGEWLAAITRWQEHPRCAVTMESMFYGARHPEDRVTYDVPCDGCVPLRALLVRALAPRDSGKEG